jgi:ubiquinone/menaquinone biosynthesis C-methylase UbiE
MYIKQVFDTTDLEVAKNICLSKDSKYPNKFKEETKFLIDFLKNKKIINSKTYFGDFGCGMGRVSREIIENFDCNIVGFDISSHMLLLAQQYLEYHDKFKIQKYKKNYKWSGDKFDVFLASFVLQHSEHPQEDIDFIYNNLKDDGILILINEKERLVPVDIKDGYAVWEDDKINITDLISKKYKNIGYFNYYNKDMQSLSLWSKNDLIKKKFETTTGILSKKENSNTSIIHKNKNIKLNVVLRTCDIKNIRNTETRIVPKDECIYVCVKSLIESLNNSKINYHIHIIDDNSSEKTRDKLKILAKNNSTFNFLSPRQESDLNSKQKSRFSVKVQYDYINNLPNEDLVYIVEDDYLHYPDSIYKMVEAWKYFSLLFPKNVIGIFPQDFNQMYYHPQNMFNDTYINKCFVFPGPDRYYRTTWFTHESFMVPVSLIKQYFAEFNKLNTLGSVEGAWEGNTISNVWQKEEMLMLMPLGTLAIHLGFEKDISFFTNWKNLYQNLKNI